MAWTVSIWIITYLKLTYHLIPVYSLQSPCDNPAKENESYFCTSQCLFKGVCVCGYLPFFIQRHPLHCSTALIFQLLFLHLFHFNKAFWIVLKTSLSSECVSLTEDQTEDSIWQHEHITMRYVSGICGFTLPFSFQLSRCHTSHFSVSLLGILPLVISFIT